MSDSIYAVRFTFRRGMNILLPTWSQFDAHTRQVSVHADLSDRNIIDFLTRRLSDIAIEAEGNQCVTGQLCHVLQQAFATIPPAKSNNGEFNENLAIMITDGTLHLGDNVLAASDEFNRCGITLVVVSTATYTSKVRDFYSSFTFEVWNYYRTLADYTGGDYMLSENALHHLSQVILSAFDEGDTLRQAFLRMRIANLPVVPSNIGDTNEQQQATDDVGEHGLSQ